MFVVNFCLKTPSEATHKPHRVESELVFSDSAPSSNDASSVFHFVDYFVASDSKPHICLHVITVAQPLVDDACVSHKPYLFVQFRAPPSVA